MTKNDFKDIIFNLSKGVMLMNRNFYLFNFCFLYFLVIACIFTYVDILVDNNNLKNDVVLIEK